MSVSSSLCIVIVSRCCHYFCCFLTCVHTDGVRCAPPRRARFRDRITSPNTSVRRSRRGHPHRNCARYDRLRQQHRFHNAFSHCAPYCALTIVIHTYFSHTPSIEASPLPNEAPRFTDYHDLNHTLHYSCHQMISSHLILSCLCTSYTVVVSFVN